MEKMTTEKDDILQKFTDISEEIQAAKDEYEKQNDAWWEGLTEKEREDAFYAVCKRIWKADGQDRGSYRHTLYQVFGFDTGMYGRGLDCGYMSIHNAIFDGEELNAMSGINRLEVIDADERSYVRYLDKREIPKYSLQDDNNTLKIFIDDKIIG